MAVGRKSEYCITAYTDVIGLTAKEYFGPYNSNCEKATLWLNSEGIDRLIKLLQAHKEVLNGH
jgi:hypothetical protein